eukprot:c722_g1_i1.p1 GENE.c722_g1_i1~~c722_g1_i1.p1  ORF type:complete len:250 (+),score=126.30 c722_g1_i1:66-815(+)
MAERLKMEKPEGADASYDGAYKSSFDKATTGKSATFEAKSERFKPEHAEATPEIDVHHSGIADVVKGKPGHVWESAKPRFADPKTEGAAVSYEVAQSDFDKVASKGPSPAMRTGEHEKSRGTWMDNKEHIEAPPASALPGAFEIKKTPSPMAQSKVDRFKGLTETVSYGDPSSAPVLSDFDKARSGKPSANMAQKSDRFKEVYNVPSYGDPGAALTVTDIERQQREAKLAHQRQQAEAQAARLHQGNAE